MRAKKLELDWGFAYSSTWTEMALLSTKYWVVLDIDTIILKLVQHMYNIQINA